MIKLLQSTWSVAAVGTLLFLATTFVTLRPQKFLASSARPVVPMAGAGEKYGFLLGDNSNPEYDQMVAELKKERASLSERAQRLRELEIRLQSERSEITTITQAIHQLQKDFDQSVVRVREEETANLKKLAKTYAAMSPDTAALVLKEMLDDQIVKILVFMKESEVGPVLESLSKVDKDQPKRVAAISERLRLATFRPDKSKTQ